MTNPNSGGTLNRPRYALWALFMAILPFHGTGQSTDSLLIHYRKMFADVPVETGFMLNVGFMYPERVEEFLWPDSVPLSQRVLVTTTGKWKRIYGYLRNSRRDTTLFGMPPLSSFPQSSSLQDPVVHIGACFIDGDYIEPDSLTFYFDSVAQKVIPNAPKKRLNIFSVSNLRESIYTKNVIFQLDPNLYFSNRPETVLGFEIDFGDGNGPRSFPFESRSIPVQYGTTGAKNLVFALITDQGTLRCFSKLIVRSGSRPGTVVKTIEVDLPDGSTTKASYQIDPGCDGVLDRPFIVVEGFDPTDRVRADESFEKYETAGITDYLQNNGYDFVGVQFHHNNDYLRNNAQLLKAIIRQINEEKVGHFENILVGESMGGIISRIALAQLESENVDPEVGLYVSFDSPHGGANIPLSIQQFSNDLLELELDDFLNFIPDFILDILPGISLGDALWVAGIFSEDAEDAYNSIKANDSPAARQMLIRHYQHRHEISPDYLAFQEELKGYGFPSRSRNIAMANGTSAAVGQNFASDYYLNYSQHTGWFDCISHIHLRALKSPVNEVDFEASRIQIQFLCETIGPDKSTRFTFFDKPYDVCPGSVNTIPLLDNNVPCFVPTAHSIDLKKDLLATPAGLSYFNQLSSDPSRHKKFLVEHKFIPFDDVYAQTFNTDHINLTNIGHLVQLLKEREFMFQHLYLQNRVFAQGQERQFYATSSVTSGRNVNSWPDKEIESGDFRVAAGAQVTLAAGAHVQLKPGVKVEPGGAFKLRIQSDAPGCKPAGNQRGQEFADDTYRDIIPRPLFTTNVQGGSVRFQVSIPFEKAEGADYHWLVEGPDTRLSGKGLEFEISGLKAGQYAVTCSLFDGDRSYTQLFTIKNHPIFEARSSMVASENVGRDNTLLIFPNPASEQLWVDCHLRQEGSAIIRLSDINGVLQMTKTLALSKEIHSPLDVSKLPAGIYFLTLQSGDEYYQAKVLVR